MHAEFREHLVNSALEGALTTGTEAAELAAAVHSGIFVSAKHVADEANACIEAVIAGDPDQAAAAFTHLAARSAAPYIETSTAVLNETLSFVRGWVAARLGEAEVTRMFDLLRHQLLEEEQP